MNVARNTSDKTFFYATEMGLILYLLGTHYHLNLVLLKESRVIGLSLGKSDVKITDKSRSESHRMVSSNVVILGYKS